MELSKKEAEVVIGLIKQAFLDGYADEELVQLFERLKKFVEE